MIASAIGLIEHNEVGVGDPNDPAYQMMNYENPARPQTLVGEELYGGTVRYFRAGSGSKLEQLKNTTPTEATDRLMERLIRNALIGAGMPPEYYWKPEGTGANVRLIISKVNRTINDRQDLIRSVARRRIGYAVSKAIKLGILPKYKGSDLGGSLRWNFTLPPVLTVDAGYANQDTREAYKLGLKNMTEILSEQGKTLEQHISERVNEELAIRQAMEEYDLPLSSFKMTTANGNPPDQEEEEMEDEEPATENETEDGSEAETETETEDQPKTPSKK
jgi:phage gpG-like protein